MNLDKKLRNFKERKENESSGFSFSSSTHRPSMFYIYFICKLFWSSTSFTKYFSGTNWSEKSLHHSVMFLYRLFNERPSWWLNHLWVDSPAELLLPFHINFNEHDVLFQRLCDHIGSNKSCIMLVRANDDTYSSSMFINIIKLISTLAGFYRIASVSEESIKNLIRFFQICFIKSPWR